MVSLVAGPTRDVTHWLPVLCGNLIDGESFRFGDGFWFLHTPLHCRPMTLLIDSVGAAYAR